MLFSNPSITVHPMILCSTVIWSHSSSVFLFVVISPLLWSLMIHSEPWNLRFFCRFAIPCSPWFGSAKSWKETAFLTTVSWVLEMPDFMSSLWYCCNVIIFGFALLQVTCSSYCIFDAAQTMAASGKLSVGEGTEAINKPNLWYFQSIFCFVALLNQECMAQGLVCRVRQGNTNWLQFYIRKASSKSFNLSFLKFFSDTQVLYLQL